MVKEIREEVKKHWIGPDEKVNVVYEDGKKVGEIRHEVKYGCLVDRLLGAKGENVENFYDKRNNLVSETRHEVDRFKDKNIDRTYTPDGKFVSETRHDIDEVSVYGAMFGLRDQHVGRTYNDKGELIQETRYHRELPLIGKSISVGVVYDKTKKPEPPKINPPVNYSDDGCYYQTNTQQKNLENKATENKIERKVEEFKPGLFPVYHDTTKEEIETAMRSGLYIGVTRVPSNYLCTYKCTRCGHRWEETRNEYDPEGIDSSRCQRGCKQPGDFPFLSLIVSFFTGMEFFGHGELVKKTIYPRKK